MNSSLRISILAVLAVVVIGGLAFALTRTSTTEARSPAVGEVPNDLVRADTTLDHLTEMQYYVTQEDGTEPPFENAYWDNKRPGIYVDIVSGEALFSSKDKFESGTGWPSFTRPLAPENVETLEDRSAGMVRTEVRSAGADSHLGHLFRDGPAPTGLRYCLNSAALRFVPADRLEAEGYGQFASEFE